MIDFQGFHLKGLRHLRVCDRIDNLYNQEFIMLADRVGPSKTTHDKINVLDDFIKSFSDMSDAFFDPAHPEKRDEMIGDMQPSAQDLLVEVIQHDLRYMIRNLERSRSDLQDSRYRKKAPPKRIHDNDFMLTI